MKPGRSSHTGILYICVHTLNGILFVDAYVCGRLYAHACVCHVPVVCVCVCVWFVIVIHDFSLTVVVVVTIDKLLTRIKVSHKTSLQVEKEKKTSLSLIRFELDQAFMLDSMYIFRLQVFTRTYIFNVWQCFMQRAEGISHSKLKFLPSQVLLTLS